MITKFAQDIYRLELPMDYGPLPDVNCYVIKGEKRSLLVDTGHNTEKCREKLTQALDELGVGKDELDIFLTHGHVDHIGQCAFLAGEGTTVYISEQEYLMTQKLTDPQYWLDIEGYFKTNGWPDSPEYSFFVAAYQQKQPFQFNCRMQYIKDGDIIHAAGRPLQTLLTPGHTKEHMSLFDVENRIVFVGDLVVENFYPTLYYRENNLDMLNLYQESLEKVKNTKAGLLLSGHKDAIYDVEKACDGAVSNYQKISRKTAGRLQRESGDAYTIACDIYKERWESYPLRKKWFCTAGVLSCLESFSLRGTAKKYLHKDKIIFSVI